MGSGRLPASSICFEADRLHLGIGSGGPVNGRSRQNRGFGGVSAQRGHSAGTAPNSKLALGPKQQIQTAIWHC